MERIRAWRGMYPPSRMLARLEYQGPSFIRGLVSPKRPLPACGTSADRHLRADPALGTSPGPFPRHHRQGAPGAGVSSSNPIAQEPEKWESTTSRRPPSGCRPMGGVLRAGTPTAQESPAMLKAPVPDQRLRQNSKGIGSTLSNKEQQPVQAGRTAMRVPSGAHRLRAGVIVGIGRWSTSRLLPRAVRTIRECPAARVLTAPDLQGCRLLPPAVGRACSANPQCRGIVTRRPPPPRSRGSPLTAPWARPRAPVRGTTGHGAQRQGPMGPADTPAAPARP